MADGSRSFVTVGADAVERDERTGDDDAAAAPAFTETAFVGRSMTLKYALGRADDGKARERPHMPNSSTTHSRWEARPFSAAMIRWAAFLTPIAASVVAVAVASKLIPAPASSLGLYLAWWLGMAVGATLVLVAIDRLSRRILPLAALLKLSLVFPDQTPSRFSLALRQGTPDGLARRVESARSAPEGEAPVEAAERLFSLVAALDHHDRITRGHAERVRAYARMIGEELGLDRDEIDLLNWAALLHDVGKLEIDQEILNKPGVLTQEEWKKLRNHPALGAQLVNPLRGWLGTWLGAVSDHHERWDGQGYPQGLEGGQIALAGRIVAVADVFDVITSSRSYKPSETAAEGRDEIARYAGSQFDPRVVRAFLNISLGRLRLVMGPLSWLAHAPILGRLPLGPAVGTVTGGLAAVVAAVATGLAGHIPDTAPCTANGHARSADAANRKS